ncbi:MAG TPA: FHA domain-containing protein [Ktedonobacteraceae bacterium]|nr:FHA domain-containing protein [Ktedonobacteraceae bacterium]
MEATLTSMLGIVPLRNTVFTIGRSPNNELFINHVTVSRHHAEVRPDGPGFSIIDLGSTSGTFVNGERLVPHMPRQLHPGDAVQVGSFPLLYEEKHTVLSLDAMPTTSMASPSSPDWPLSGAVAQSGNSADNLPEQVEQIAFPELVSPSPIPNGLPSVSDRYTYQANDLSANERKMVPGGSSPDFRSATPPVGGQEVARRGSSPDFRREAVPLMEPAHRAIAGVVFPPSAQAKPVNLAQKQLQFTAFYPRAASVETWHTLLVYAHVDATLEAVRADAQRWNALSDADPFAAHALAARPSTEGTQITVVPVFQGITFQPERTSFTWTNAWHAVPLRFCADHRWAGTVSQGEVLLLAGPLIIASLRVSLRFAEPGTQPDPSQGEISVARYKNIFTSYSWDDVSMVQAIRRAYEAIGDDSFLDIEALRSGQSWNSALPRAIESADVFQLFWSSHAAQSQYIYQECQHALQHYKYDGFIRPLYWEKPLAFSPPELSHLHFTYYELAKSSSPANPG